MYLGVAYNMIWIKYPTTHKAVLGTQLGVASIGRGVLQKIGQVGELACNPELSTYYVSV